MLTPCVAVLSCLQLCDCHHSSSLDTELGREPDAVSAECGWFEDAQWLDGSNLQEVPAPQQCSNTVREHWTRRHSHEQ